MNFNDVAIASIKGNNYRIHFWYISKNDTINIMNNTNLNEKSDYKFFFAVYKRRVEQLIIKETEK